MKSDIITIQKKDLRVIEDRSDTIDNLNRKIQIIRKRQLMATLKETTGVRLDLLRKLKGWIDKLDKRLFSDDSINNMSLDKVISLFKYVGTFSLKMMGQMNDIENIMKEYIQTASVSEKVSTLGQNGNPTQQNELKKELLRSFMDSIKQSAAEAIVSQQKQEAEQVIEMKKIEEEKEVVDPVDDLKLEDIPVDLVDIK